MLKISIGFLGLSFAGSYLFHCNGYFIKEISNNKEGLFSPQWIRTLDKLIIIMMMLLFLFKVVESIQKDKDEIIMIKDNKINDTTTISFKKEVLIKIIYAAIIYLLFALVMNRVFNYSFIRLISPFYAGTFLWAVIYSFLENIPFLFKESFYLTTYLMMKYTMLIATFTFFAFVSKYLPYFLI